MIKMILKICSRQNDLGAGLGRTYRFSVVGNKIRLPEDLGTEDQGTEDRGTAIGERKIGERKIGERKIGEHVVEDRGAEDRGTEDRGTSCGRSGSRRSGKTWVVVSVALQYTPSFKPLPPTVRFYLVVYLQYTFNPFLLQYVYSVWYTDSIP